MTSIDPQRRQQRRQRQHHRQYRKALHMRQLWALLNGYFVDNNDRNDLRQSALSVAAFESYVSWWHSFAIRIAVTTQQQKQPTLDRRRRSQRNLPLVDSCCSSVLHMDPKRPTVYSMIRSTRCRRASWTGRRIVLCCAIIMVGTMLASRVRGVRAWQATVTSRLAEGRCCHSFRQQCRVSLAATNSRELRFYSGRGGVSGNGSTNSALMDDYAAFSQFAPLPDGTASAFHRVHHHQSMHHHHSHISVASATAATSLSHQQQQSQNRNKITTSDHPAAARGMTWMSTHYHKDEDQDHSILTAFHPTALLQHSSTLMAAAAAVSTVERLFGLNSHSTAASPAPQARNFGTFSSTTGSNNSNNNESLTNAHRRRQKDSEDGATPSVAREASAAGPAASSSTHLMPQVSTTLSAPKSSSISTDASSSSSTISVKHVAAASMAGPQQGYGCSIQLTLEEKQLFQLLRQVREETGLTTTLRVAGGWVRDKLLATPEFRAYHYVFEVGKNPMVSSETSSSSSCSASSSSPKNNERTARLTSKFHRPAASAPGSMGRQGTKVLINSNNILNGQPDCQPVDIDIALDDMLGREFADHLNDYLCQRGKDTVSVGVVLKNPEKSKHLETATMKVGPFWIDFVNLRAEEYTQDSRIPDLMRIGTAAEDAFRRDLTINALFYNINTGQVEDWTGRGFADLRKGVVATPLAPLTTLLDDPLRVLRSIRFAARLRFTMDDDLVCAAKDVRVKTALAQKVSRERVGGEVDLMLRSPDPVNAMRLLINLQLVDVVFPVAQYLIPVSISVPSFFAQGLVMLATAHDHLADCRLSPPLWCINKKTCYGIADSRLIEDPEARRLLWYAAFLKPLWDAGRQRQKGTTRSTVTLAPSTIITSRKTNRSMIRKLLVDDLKRPIRDAEAVERILQAADDFAQLLKSRADVSATMILLSNVRITYVPISSTKNNLPCSSDVDGRSETTAGRAGTGTGTTSGGRLLCSMNGGRIDSATEEDPVWEHAMEFRLLCSKIMDQIGSLWRAAFVMAISEQLASIDHSSSGIDGDGGGGGGGGFSYAIEGDIVDESQEEMRQGVIERFDIFATAMQQVGVIGIWNERALLDGSAIQQCLPRLPHGPAFRLVMDAQREWMIMHPGASAEYLVKYLRNTFPEYASEDGVVVSER